MTLLHITNFSKMVEIDKEFAKKWPFGIVMTAQWFGCLILLIILYFSPYYYSGTSFVFFCAWTIFLVGLLTWAVHLFGFQRQVLNIGQMSAFIPFALLLFVYSLLFFFLFCISALICMISMFSSIGFAVSLFLIYFFATATVCGYLAILLYRATPNGLLLNLRTVIIEGDKTSSISTTTATMSPGIYPESTNPV
uniref:MARVEL domain-containing protein n=1 Tax=Onchocerca volvulus TaxID=6282 RepID=A0A8R1XL24_ONCVO